MQDAGDYEAFNGFQTLTLKPLMSINTNNNSDNSQHFFSLTLGSVFLCSFELSMIFHMQFDDVVRGLKRSAEVSLPVQTSRDPQIKLAHHGNISHMLLYWGVCVGMCVFNRVTTVNTYQCCVYSPYT